MKFDIAIGKSRNDKVWVNKEFTWFEFTQRLIKTTRTQETIAEYLSFSKDVQDKIKDVGGFVSGKLAGGRRLKESVISKQILTLDVDEATIHFWNLFTLEFDCCACLYSTHKHQNLKPKYRLLIPLASEVMKDEYEAICRKVCSLIGIDFFDHTCYRATQLMYWPSTPKDGEYVYKEQQGELLNPQGILNLYHDWKDINEWPIGSREKRKKEHAAKHQGDPLAKPGLIGYFNNTYTIEEAIETFLSDVYEKVDETRYTYKEGSTSGGVVIYDNKFIYSHHSSDPISENLCNAFDLVRLHKFGLQDTDVIETTPVNKLPSYVAMCELASEDANVKKTIGQLKLEAAKDSFKDVVIYKESNDDWLSETDIDRKGNYINTINNVALIIENDSNLAGCLAYDEFIQTPVWLYKPPWRDIKKKKHLTNNDLANLENYIEKTYKLKSGSTLLKGLSIVYEKNSFHPITTYLKSLSWDGTKRLDNIFIDYLGCENSAYTKSVTRKCLVAAVARVFEPGIKFDTILVLVGGEGQGKSTIWNKLGGAWFSDTFSLNMLKNSNQAYEQLQGSWLIEIAELSGMAKAEIEHVKSFVSSHKDKYRSAYAVMIEERLRQCIFVGSTNIWDFLKSQSGNRRFWPVATYITKPTMLVHDIDQETIDQIWAEAYEFYQAGEKLYLDNINVLNEAIRIQSEFTEEDPLVELIESFLEYKIPENWYNMSLFDKQEFINNYDAKKPDLLERDRVCKYEIWELVMNKREKLDAYGLKQIKQAMRKIKGWEVDKDLIRFGLFYPRHRGSWWYTLASAGTKSLL